MNRATRTIRNAIVEDVVEAAKELEKRGWKVDMLLQGPTEENEATPHSVSLRVLVPRLVYGPVTAEVLETEPAEVVLEKIREAGVRDESGANEIGSPDGRGFQLS